MDNAIYEFTVGTRGTLFAKFLSNVKVFEDRVQIQRTGRLGSLPESVTIPFDNGSSILYTKNTVYPLINGIT